ncbi:MAG: hypothetical protein L0Y56_19860, partial [Nitrospira sp.]|nr:hypothetical protein [Nitrospira sp.]
MANSTADVRRAKLKFRRLLLEAGYDAPGMWRLDDNKRLWRMLLNDEVGGAGRIVAVLWQFQDSWQAMLAVDNEGREIPFSGGDLGSWKPWPLFTSSKKLKDLQTTLQIWNHEPAQDVYKPLSELALFNLNRGAFS